MPPTADRPLRRPRLLGGAVGLALAGLGATVILAVVVAAGSAGPGGPATVPRFVEETSTAGIEQAYEGDFEYFVGGGVAAFDCSDDGRPELYIAGGTNDAALFANESSRGGSLRFSRIVDAATDLDAVTGAYPLDVDSDGVTDLAVLRRGENVVLRGLGGCRFERANEQWDIDGGRDWTAAFSATWEPGAAWPTLAFANYLGMGGPDDPDDRCATSYLQRPAAAGGYDPPLPLEPAFCPLSALFSDWDRSGRRDLRLSNDRHYAADAVEQLWRVEPGRAPRLYTADDGWQPLRIWGMGIASQDLTGDGLPEIFLTSQGDNKLLELVEGPARPRYRNVAIERNASAHRPYAGDTTLPSTAWHAEFQDLNNDAFMDLFVAKGNVEAQPDFAARDPSNLILGQRDGTFAEVAPEAGIVSFARARGAAVVDLDLDGLLDLVVVNRREPVKVWRNVGAGTAAAPAPIGHWAALRLRQPAPNRDAIGASIEVRLGDRTVTRELIAGGGHAGGQLGWIHVGLGDATTAEVRVRWPDAVVGPWLELPADGWAIIDRDAGTVTPWHPGA